MVFDIARATSHYYVTFNPVKINNESSSRRDLTWKFKWIYPLGQIGVKRKSLEDRGL
jgi:hypothetical protein